MYPKKLSLLAADPQIIGLGTLHHFVRIRTVSDTSVLPQGKLYKVKHTRKDRDSRIAQPIPVAVTGETCSPTEYTNVYVCTSMTIHPISMLQYYNSTQEP